MFLDRDGVINHDTGFITSLEAVELIKDVKSSLEDLKKLFKKIVVVTNQSAIARGLTNVEQVNEINFYLNNLLGGIIEHFFVCPHLPADGCYCRKPLTGHLDGVSWWSQDLAKNSVMVGDRETDLLFGKNLGLKNCFLMVGTHQASSELGVSVNNWQELVRAIKALKF